MILLCGIPSETPLRLVVDRIESAGADWQGATVATYQIGYQVALICSGAVALLVASHQGWTGDSTNSG